MAYSVTRSPARLCNRDGKLCYYGHLEYDFLVFFCALLPTFLIFSFRILVCLSSLCSFVCAAFICYYSQQVRSNVKTTATNNNISSQVRHAYVTKGTYAFIYSYVLYTLVPVYILYYCTYILCSRI